MNNFSLMYEGKSVNIDDLPEGQYTIQLPVHNTPRFPIIRKSKLLEKIQEFEYKGKIIIRGPFTYLKKYTDSFLSWRREAK